jgi:serine/threonine-protein kinase
MAPEQARGEDVDHRADVYALAAITYRALTGRPAFTGKDLPSTLYDVVYKMPTRPSKQWEKLTGDIDLVLAIGMAKRPEDRFASARDLADALAMAAKSELGEILRARARAILSNMPWGSRR